MDVHRKRWRLRFHLSTAIILMIVAGSVLGIYIRRQYVDEDEKSRRTIEEAMGKSVPCKFVDTPLVEAIHYLVGYARPRMNVILCPTLERDNASITLTVKNTSINDALARLGVNWEIRSGALFVYPKNAVLPPKMPRPSTDQGFKSETVSRMSHKLSFCFVDTPMSEQIGFFSGLCKVNIGLDPKCENPDKAIEAAWRVEDMRLDDAIAWSCYFADAEWTLKKTANGEDVIWIAPRIAK